MLAHRARELYDQARALREAARADREAADLKRRIAANVSAVLAELLGEAGVPMLRVIDGRIVVEAGEGDLRDFETRLSFGEKVRVALEVVARGIAGSTRDRVPVVALDPAFWLALDPERRAEVGALAHETGVALLTEEPTEGELRVEVAE